MDDDAEPQSLFVVVSWDSASPYYSSIIQLETQVHNHEYASSAIETEFSAHIPRLPLVQRPISWAISLPPESSTEDLYMLLGCPLRKSETEKGGKLPGLIFNLSTKKCKIIKAPLAPKYMGHVVTMGDHIYFMAQPGKNSPDPRFERYDTLSQSWEEREPLPLLTDGRIGLIEGTAVLDDTILFNIDYHKMWAYNVGRDKWYPVTVKDNLCYNIVGVAVVLNKIIYAITKLRESVVAMTLKSQEIEGDLVFTCDLHKEYVVPGMEQVKFDLWDSYEWTRHLVHLGKDNFCVVQSCNHFGVQNQYIQVTYIEVSDKKSIVTNICLHEFKLPRGDQFIIRQCFSMPKCKTTALKEGNRFLKLNPEHEAEIATLPPELASIIKIGDPRAVIEEKRGTGLTEGGSVSQTSRSRDDVDTTPEVQEDVPKKSSASSQSRDDADTKTRQVQEDVPKTSSASVAKASTLGDGHSIFVTNLPPEGNYLQFFKGLKRFGPIKSLALHIDHNNTSESFAHVEFESATSKQNAIKASIIKIGDRRAVIAEKRGTSLTQGGSVGQTSRSRDDVDTTPEVQEDVPKKSSASSQGRDDADTKTRQVQEDIPKKSSASVVAGKSNVPSKASTVTGHQSLNYATKASTLGDGHSICVTNLPLDANCRQLVKRLKRFGPIKSVGIKTYFDNMSECCFADVEFESATSKENAIKESILEIGNHIAVIEEKRGTGLTQGDSNRSSSSPRNKLKKHGKDSRSKTSRKGLSRITPL